MKQPLSDCFTKSVNTAYTLLRSKAIIFALKAISPTLKAVQSALMAVQRAIEVILNTENWLVAAKVGSLSKVLWANNGIAERLARSY